MKRFTEKVHYEQQKEVVWVMREEDDGQSEQDEEKRKSNDEQENDFLKTPIVYSKRYGVRFCGMEKLHPFDAAKGAHVLKVNSYFEFFFMKSMNFVLFQILLQNEIVRPGRFYEPGEITKAELQKVHTRKYLRSLKVQYYHKKIFVLNIFVSFH